VRVPDRDRLGPVGGGLQTFLSTFNISRLGNAAELIGLGRRTLDLALRYPNLHLDTTMAGTRFMDYYAPVPAGVIPRLGELSERIVLGTDFPQIPYPYAEQLAALAEFGLGDEWLRAVCWHNPVRLLGIAP
jgi:predicted TIM-barrel fold metal-dependent hydrolase